MLKFPLYDRRTQTFLLRNAGKPGVLHISTLLEWDMPFDETLPSLDRSKPLYADVIIPRHIAKAFTYLVPPALTDSIGIGRRVLVPFGRVVLDGAVISLSNQRPTELSAASVKEIRSLSPDSVDTKLSSTLFELSRKIADYYVVPWGQCIRLVFSPMATGKTSSTRYAATQQGRVALETGNCPDQLRPTLDRIARRTRGILSSTLRSARQGNASRVIDALLKRSWIALVPSNNAGVDSRKRRGKLVADKYDHGTPVDALPPTEKLPEVDSSWRAHVIQCLQSNHMRKIVLHAPWQHRITRLADAIRQTHSLNRSTIVVCGETARALWLKQVLSSLTGLPITFAQPSSAPERSPQHQGPSPSVLVGTRSAIFAPVDSIGLIWIEGEEDPALKEPQEPRYHAREVACLRAEVDQAVVILASAHPSLESRFDSTAEIDHVQLDTSGQPTIELVDLRQESGGTLFSQRLVSAIREALENQNKVLLFLNRKGYARSLICRDCGWVPRCPSCVVPLTYYREAGRLTCRYCGTGEGLPDRCPVCHASRMSPVGDGTERVEAEILRLFPHANIARLDGDTLRRPTSARSLWERARSGAWDILIGTEALFRRAPLPQHGLVGILQADSGLHISDFRAAERTYHLLVDAASLACPASAGGRVILQTRLPAHHAIQAVLLGDPHLFYNEELAARRLLNYPPACHVADLAVTGTSLTVVEEAATRWGAELQWNTSDQESIIVLGPVPAIGRAPRGHHHRRILVKGTDLGMLTRRLHDSVASMERQYRTRQIKFVVDMDPVESR